MLLRRSITWHSSLSRNANSPQNGGRTVDTYSTRSTLVTPDNSYMAGIAQARLERTSCRTRLGNTVCSALSNYAAPPSPRKEILTMKDLLLLPPCRLRKTPPRCCPVQHKRRVRRWPVYFPETSATSTSCVGNSNEPKSLRLNRNRPLQIAESM